MKLVKISEIKGNEKLARAVMTSDYKELLASGTVLKPEYVEKIAQLGIKEVMIEDEKLSSEQVMILREDVEDLFKEKVKSVIERHVYSDNKELEELSKTADSIITNILDSDEVVERIYDIKERNADIYEHSISVCSLSVLVACKLKMDKDAIHDLGVASLFHDMGLRYLDFSFSNMELEELTDKEKLEYRKHPAYAFSSLEKETWLTDRAKLMILQHHERIDGSGYPMHAKNISMESAVLEVVDAFDEMICGIGCLRSRVYEAVEYLKVFKGSKFDKECVDNLLEFTAVYPAGSVVELNTGEWAIVVRQNRQFPERPVLKIVKDKNKKTLDKEIECDLISVHNVYIEKVIM